jgi:hypothetical protein
VINDLPVDIFLIELLHVLGVVFFLFLTRALMFSTIFNSIVHELDCLFVPIQARVNVG